jgi:hypothetical protein
MFYMPSISLMSSLGSSFFAPPHGSRSAYFTEHYHSCSSALLAAQSFQVVCEFWILKQDSDPLLGTTSLTFFIEICPSTVMSSLSCVKYSERPLRRN